MRRRGAARRWCPECGCYVDVVDLVQAEVVTGATRPRAGDCVEEKKWHSFQGADGTLLVCLDSLLKST